MSSRIFFAYKGNTCYRILSDQMAANPEMPVNWGVFWVFTLNG